MAVTSRTVTERNRLLRCADRQTPDGVCWSVRLCVFDCENIFSVSMFVCGLFVRGSYHN